MTEVTEPVPSQPSPSGGRARALAIAGAVVVVALVATGLFVLLDSDDASAGEVHFEPLGSVGIDPFTASVSAEPDAELVDFASDPSPRGPLGVDPALFEQIAPESAGVDSVAADSAGELVSNAQDSAVAVVVGTEPGLYGGTQDAAACDPDQLVAFLAEDDEKAAAWAAVQGIEPDEIAEFVAGLTPVRLTEDTLVLNHGFEDGRATPRHSVLQKGEAVLVDAEGVPRVKCSCGNPLLAPTDPALLDDADPVGEPWDGYERAGVEVIVPAADRVDGFVMRDIGSDEVFVRPVGTTDDVPATELLAPAAPEPTPTPAPTPTPDAPPTPLPPPTPDAVNPFEEGDPILEDLPLPDDLPPGAGTFAAPRAGSWVALGTGGTITCDGFTLPVPADSGDQGAVEVSADGTRITFSASTIQLDLSPVDGVLGRYQGTATTDQEGVAVVSDITVQVVTDELMVGTYTGTASADGTTCTFDIGLRMEFVG